jgi:hypothetical protein
MVRPFPDDGWTALLEDAMPATDRQRLVNCFAASDRFRGDIECSPEMGIMTLEDIYAVLAPLQPFFDRAERGEYPLDTMKDADLRAMSGAILPLRYEAAGYRLVSLSKPLPRPDWMTPETFDMALGETATMKLLRDSTWRTFSEELLDGWGAVIASRLPRESTIAEITSEVWHALGMAMTSNVRAYGGSVWPLIEAPIVLYVGAALAREDQVTRNFAALLPHLLKILPVGAMPGPSLYGGPILCAVV